MAPLHARRLHPLTATEGGLTLARILADGAWHSEPEMASHLGSGAMVEAAIRRLGQLGLRVERAAGACRLSVAIEFLDPNALLAALEARSRRLLSGLELHDVLESTNRYVLEQSDRSVGAWACFAEYQSAGRGRQGRTWVSPLAANIYLSLLWNRPTRAEWPGGTTLAAGVAVARAVEEAGTQGVGLKWPNDLYWRGQKLGGVLVEAVSRSSGARPMVVGVGLNVRMPLRAAEAIGQPWTDLEGVVGRTVSRNLIAGRLLHHLLIAMSEHEKLGLGACLADWRRLDLTAGKTVTLHAPAGKVTGVAVGITETGELKLYQDGGIGRYACGEVSLRSA
jgi:BirA family biotin operon repressor/biotin-[acetyl-CoA-carboxylase] ligase